MIASIEFQNRFPPSKRAGKPHRTHGCFSSTRHKAHHLHVRHAVADELAEFYLELGRHAERGSVAHRGVERVEHHWVRVPEHKRPPRQHVVDVFPAISVPDPGTFTLCCNDWISTNSAKCADWRVHSSGKQ